MVRAVIMGTARINCPIIIAYGVKRRPKVPKGPLLDIIEYTIRPTTTVGKAIKVLNRVIKGPFPLKELIPIKNPKGTPIIEDKRIAEVDILIEIKVMEKTSRSREIISFRALIKPFTRSSITPPDL
jgi:hypothetical protein